MIRDAGIGPLIRRGEMGRSEKLIPDGGAGAKILVEMMGMHGMVNPVEAIVGDRPTENASHVKARWRVQVIALNADQQLRDCHDPHSVDAHDIGCGKQDEGDPEELLGPVEIGIHAAQFFDGMMDRVQLPEPSVLRAVIQ